jgi:phosphoglycolate phosphatase
VTEAELAAARSAPGRSAPGYRLAIFDFDGTLADTGAWFRSVVNDIARRYRFREVSPAELDDLRSVGTREVLRALRIPWWKLPAIARYTRKIAARDIDRMVRFPGIEAALAALDEAGIGLAVVSSNSEANVRRVLGPGTADRIRLYACGASLLGKERHLRRVVKRSGVPAAEVIAIGDEARDIEAATAAGIAAGAVTWGYGEPGALRACRPALVFGSVEEMAARLAG